MSGIFDMPDCKEVQTPCQGFFTVLSGGATSACAFRRYPATVHTHAYQAISPQKTTLTPIRKLSYAPS